MGFFKDLGNWTSGLVSDVSYPITSPFGKLLKESGKVMGQASSASSMLLSNSGQNAVDEALAKEKADLLQKQKAAADFQETSKIASSAYGAALGGSNIQSNVNRSGKKSILGGF